MDDPLLSNFRTKRVQIYRNGDPFTAARTVVVSHKNFKNWEQLLRHISVELNQAGAIRRLYRCSDGSRVGGMLDLVDGETYVAAKLEPFKSVDYGGRVVRRENPGKRQPVSSRAAKSRAESSANDGVFSPVVSNYF